MCPAVGDARQESRPPLAATVVHDARHPRETRARSSAWLRHWGPLLPLMGATRIVMLGFGAMIPVLSLYVQSQGITAASIGIIISGGPLADSSPSRPPAGGRTATPASRRWSWP